MIEMILQLVLGIASLFILFALLFFIVVVFHEAGHILALLFFRKKFEVGWEEGAFYVGTEKDYKGLATAERAIVLLAGIFLGLWPLMGIIVFVQLFWIQIIIIGMYIVGCKSDLTQLYYLFRKRESIGNKSKKSRGKRGEKSET